MSTLRLVDTNVIIRHLVQDHQSHSPMASALFEACDRGDLDLVVLPAVLAECVFLLGSFYQYPRARTSSVLSGLMDSPGVDLAELDVHLDALSRYAATDLDFVDCLIAAIAAATGLKVATFDSDFKKFSDVTVSLTA